MPHPERAVDPAHGGTDGARLFAGLAAALARRRPAGRLSRARPRRIMIAPMSHGRRRAAPDRALRAASGCARRLLASVVGMVLVIWASHIYLTRAFSEDQNADATVRATLYAGVDPERRCSATRWCRCCSRATRS